MVAPGNIKEGGEADIGVVTGKARVTGSCILLGSVISISFRG